MAHAQHPKIVLIGAGSRCFTAALLNGILASDEFDGGTIGLVDVDAEVLALVEKLTRLLVRETGRPIEVMADTDRRAVLRDADYVTATISVGGDDAWTVDLSVPARYGCVQSTGDTCGPGGLSRGLRHAPVLVDIARDMEDLCPEAWLFNHSNPMSILTRAVSRETSIRCMGMCVGVDITKRFLSWAIGAPTADTDIWAAGINHFVFAYAFRWQGRNAYPLARARLRQAPGGDPDELARQIAAYPGLDVRPDQPIQGMQPLSAALMDHCGFFPGPGDCHVSEFVPQFFRSAGDYERYGILARDLRTQHARKAEQLQAFEDMAERRTPVDMARLGETAHEEHQTVGTVRALRRDEGSLFYVNLPNRGQIRNLPDEAVVEGPCRMGQFGPSQLAIGPLPDVIAAWTRPWCAWQEAVIDAALSGDRGRAMDAMMMDPGCRGIDASRKMLDELLDGNANVLPRFRRGPGDGTQSSAAADPT